MPYQSVLYFFECHALCILPISLVGRLFFIYTIMSFERLMPSYVLRYRIQHPDI
jgi:hypothetical protein